MTLKLPIDGISVTFHAAGNFSWSEEVVIPLARDIGEVLPRHRGEIPPALRARMNRSGMVANGALGFLVVGVVIFVAKEIAGPTLKDFYEIVLKPRICRCFKKMDARLSGGNRKSKKEFVANIWYQEHGVVVSVSVIGDDMAAIEAQLDMMGQIHLSALAWIETRGVSAPVHQYRIENGKVNVEPVLLKRLTLV